MQGIVAKCPKCNHLLFIREDQLKRRVRCPKCRNAFACRAAEVDGNGDNSNLTTEPPVVQSPADQETAQDPGSAVPVDDAFEPMLSGLQRPKKVSRFDLSAPLVFDAFVQAIRGFNFDLLELNQTNLQMRFSIRTHNVDTLHDVYVFSFRNSCEVEIVGREPLGKDQLAAYDSCYEMLVAEAKKYVLLVGNGKFVDRRRGSEERPPRDSPSYDMPGDNEPADDDDWDDRNIGPRKPGKVTAIGGMLIGGGAWAVLNAVGCVLLFPMCFFWPGLWFAVVWAILALIRGAEILGERWYARSPKTMVILQIIQAVNFDVVNVVMGIISLVFLNERRVSSSFRSQ